MWISRLTSLRAQPSTFGRCFISCDLTRSPTISPGLVKNRDRWEILGDILRCNRVYMYSGACESRPQNVHTARDRPHSTKWSRMVPVGASPILLGSEQNHENRAKWAMRRPAPFSTISSNGDDPGRCGHVGGVVRTLRYLNVRGCTSKYLPQSPNDLRYLCSIILHQNRGVTNGYCGRFDR